mmetsp:Transcript_27736/g.47175  ORF Transcript_27736/g.47175 Transcript_27736/m.47175 type:complete len:241 (-) Transcript_27736:66-788(-)|eukprot:CAMPEP_0183727034 /NCGR_PEP_ID=MMETSP0737-20130205/24647_1 /TAXON_ID=385413 /ORGANISM="Thalassiosira miniscula, Strain CCMP1093" /LENGTH=240 /DNA_ID=CAMNT_0025958551 /DNA_START=157 /DNA_END=879 /DNA_ORIENTATION=-
MVHFNKLTVLACLQAAALQFVQSKKQPIFSKTSKSQKPDDKERTADEPTIIQVADLAKCSDSFWEHPPPGGDAQVLPLRIPLDRVFDVQWNPPGHPELCAYWLQTPFGDDWGDYDTPWDREGTADLTGHYTFIKYHHDGSLGLVREKEDGTLCSVFLEVDFLSVSDDVLMMNGDPGPKGNAYGGYAGGGFGTLVKGPGIPAGNEGGCWDTTTIEESDGLTGEVWLMQNFGFADQSQLALE